MQAFASEVAGQRPALPLLQVQGAALPKNPTNETRVTARNTRATS
jgi:hypothetical protein